MSPPRGSWGRFGLVTVGLFAVAGLVAATVWHLVVDLPSYTRLADNGSMEALELSGAVAIDAWFAVIGGALALLLGSVLAVRALGRPRSLVLTLPVAALVGGLTMLATGRALGPGDLEPRLASAEVGELVPVPLVPTSGAVDLLGVPVHTIVLVWPIAALVGAALVLMLSPLPVEEPVAG